MEVFRLDEVVRVSSFKLSFLCIADTRIKRLLKVVDRLHCWRRGCGRDDLFHLLPGHTKARALQSIRSLMGAIQDFSLDSIFILCRCEVAAKVGQACHAHATRWFICDLGDHISVHCEFGKEVFEVLQHRRHGPSCKLGYLQRLVMKCWPSQKTGKSECKSVHGRTCIAEPRHRQQSEEMHEDMAQVY